MVHTPGPDDRRRRRGRRDVIDIGPAETRADGGQTFDRGDLASYYSRGVASGGFAIWVVAVGGEYFGVIVAVVIAVLMIVVLRLIELRIKAGTA